jgi:hypothetical protein
MRDGKAIPVWFSDQDKNRIEEAAALAGYQHLSKYIRDKALGRADFLPTADDSVRAWAEQQELADQLSKLQAGQAQSLALLSMLLFLVRKKATTGDLSELVAAATRAMAATDMLAAPKPDLAALSAQFIEDL